MELVRYIHLHPLSELGYTLAELAEVLNKAGPGVGYAVQRSEQIAEKSGYSLPE